MQVVALNKSGIKHLDMFFVYIHPIFFLLKSLLASLFALAFLIIPFSLHVLVYTLTLFLSSLLNLAYITIYASCTTLKFVFNEG